MTGRRRSRSEKKKADSIPPRTRSSGEESFGLLADGLGIGLALVDSGGDVRYCNATFNHALDFSPNAHGNSGSNLLDRLTSASRSDLVDALSRAKCFPVDGKFELLAQDGRLRTFHVSLSPSSTRVRDRNIWILAHEVTELIEAGKALDDSKGSVSFLSARLMQAQDAERRRMARDLHDITGQELAVILMSLTRLSNGIGNPAFDAKAELAETVALVRKVENEIRTLSYLLHPPMLDELGLKSALGWYIEGFSKRSKIQVDLDIQEALPRLSRDKEIAIFRVVQESLTNVLRHAHSSTARIRAEAKSGRLLLYVEDSGQGFPARLLPAGKSEKVVPGVGIYGMRERLEQLGGVLTIESTPRGAQVCASVPLGGEAGDPPAEELASEMQVMTAEPAQPDGPPYRILIADDHELMRVGIHTLLDGQPDLEICGDAVDGFDAVAKARALKPDLVIMDLIMPRMGGFSAAQQIHGARPSTKILVFTNYSYGQVEAMIRTIGCDGYVSKSRASTDLILALRTVLGGDQFFDSRVVHSQSA
jgi:signal transduction histidine kinase/ActR/RegA family two-component response regulator